MMNAAWRQSHGHATCTGVMLRRYACSVAILSARVWPCRMRCWAPTAPRDCEEYRGVCCGM
eukprot:9314964-Lingulodinium_polyedra.AAC.1